MRKNYKKIYKFTNAVDSAAPASVWGRGCSGKGGKTPNYDSALPYPLAFQMCFGKAGAGNA